MKDISVIGLGQMGATLARLLLAQGWRVHVWNRGAARVRPLVEQGARPAASPAEAVAAAPLVVMCVHDYVAAREILGSAGVAQAARGRLLVQLSTGSPQDAREAERWAREHGAQYLDGAIQVAPSQMGRPDTAILVSGAQAAFDRAREVLAVFGGGVVHVGEGPGAANTMDMATLSYVYGAVLGFIHGARVCETEGIPIEMYGRVVSAMSPAYGDFLKHEAGVIQSGDFSVSESPLAISVEATARLERIARESGLDTRVPALAAQLFREAGEAGLGQQELAALIKVLR